VSAVAAASPGELRRQFRENIAIFRLPTAGHFVSERKNGQWVDVPLVKTINGKTYNVADPAYRKLQ
jgi:hypothetical protein